MTKQSGSALVGLMITVIATGLIMSLVMSAVSGTATLGRAKREGDQLAAAANGLQSYLDTLGASIIQTGTASGFADAYHPTYSELKAKTYLFSFTPPATPFGGTLSFTIIKGAKNDLLGLACDTANVTENGQPSPRLAGEVASAAAGGLRTSISNPTVLSGANFPSVPSPIAGPAIVCAWAYLANPV